VRSCPQPSHLGDRTRVEHHAADQLDVEMRWPIVRLAASGRAGRPRGADSSSDSAVAARLRSSSATARSSTHRQKTASISARSGFMKSTAFVTPLNCFDLRPSAGRDRSSPLAGAIRLSWQATLATFAYPASNGLLLGLRLRSTLACRPGCPSQPCISFGWSELRPLVAVLLGPGGDVSPARG